MRVFAKDVSGQKLDRGFESRPLRFSVSRFLATVRGKPCVRGRRITVSDVLEYLASGMTDAEILADFPELTIEDIRVPCLSRLDSSPRSARKVNGQRPTKDER